ncbi:hypothetical protein FKP32DRAFT_1673864 [Trametes sanguinea]|nr:hypothetical protein FKP32DRAFT_1673864 [Trametes sanguinea]
MQLILYALIALACISTHVGAISTRMSAAAVLDEIVVLEDVPSPTIAVALPAPNVEARSAEACGFPIVPLYRVTSDLMTDHIFTTDPQEVEDALASGQWTGSEIIGAVYDPSTGPNVPDVIPLYGMNNVVLTDHFLTTSMNEVQESMNLGYVYQGIIAYVYPDAQCECAPTIPLYRRYNPTILEHDYGTAAPEPTSPSTGEDPEGYVREGITGYIFNAPE